MFSLPNNSIKSYLNKTYLLLNILETVNTNFSCARFKNVLIDNYTIIQQVKKKQKI